MVTAMAADPEPDQTSKGYSLEDAYAVETLDDCVRLYQAWASSYDDDLLDGLGYRYHVHLADSFAQSADRADGPVLDVGCGTGLVGAELARRGGWAIDGLDISPAMLMMAGEKRNPAGEPVYGSLIEADLMRPLAIATDTYGSVVSAGTFTIGHVGPEAIGELVRIVRSEGLLVLGINSDFYSQRGLDRYLAAWVNEGSIGEPSIAVVGVYSRDDHAHGADTAHLVVMRVQG